VDPVALAARGESVWHRLGLRALGIGWVEDGTVASRSEATSPVFLGALSLRPGVPAERLAAAVDGLASEVAVRDAGGAVERFERTSVEAFTGTTSGWTLGTIHPPAASLRVPGLTLLLATVDGHPVGTAIATTDGTVLNVGGVAVLASARRQGIGPPRQAT
jgi:hypothetical protein